MTTQSRETQHPGSPTSVHAEDSLLNGGGQGQPVEEAVEALPGPQALLLPQPLRALQPEAKQRIDVRCLHTTSNSASTQQLGTDINQGVSVMTGNFGLDLSARRPIVQNANCFDELCPELRHIAAVAAAAVQTGQAQFNAATRSCQGNQEVPDELLAS